MQGARECPFCGSTDTRKQANFSTSLMVRLSYCGQCRSTFEVIKWGDTEDTLDIPAFLDEREEPPGT
jgi:hypothetical protein